MKKLIYSIINYSQYIDKMKLRIWRMIKIKNSGQKKLNLDSSNITRYSLTDIFSFPEGFLSDKIFKIEYANDSDSFENSSSLHYVMLKVSKIKRKANKKSEKGEKIADKYLLQIINMDNKVLYNEA